MKRTDQTNPWFKMFFLLPNDSVDLNMIRNVAKRMKIFLNLDFALEEKKANIIHLEIIISWKG